MAVNDKEWSELQQLRLGAEAVWGAGGGGQGAQVVGAASDEGVDQEEWEQARWGLVCEHMAEAPGLEEWQWALDCVQSRSFVLETLQGVKCMCLCPMADIFNHDPTAPATLDFHPETRTFELRTRRAWSKGDEIRITYGALSNADLLQYYGFVMPRNPHDHLSIGFADLSVVLLRPAIGSEADRLDRFRV